MDHGIEDGGLIMGWGMHGADLVRKFACENVYEDARCRYGLGTPCMRR